MNGFLLPQDADWRDDKVLMAELSQLNTRVTRYIFRYLDADAGQAAPISIDDEHALGLKLMKLGEVLQARAARRETEIAGRDSTIEGEVTQPPALESDSDDGS